MPCFCPLTGYRSRVVGASGKRAVVFDVRSGFADLPVTVPCGQCAGCRLERSRQWAVRCMHEASLHDENCFVTLTYADEHLPANGSLDKRDFQRFMKRLRKRFPGERIRYYHAGEYGEVNGRPHYHACLFGFDFPDKVVWSVRRGFTVFRSPVLEVLWPFGQSELGSVTFESAAYVARYIMKKVLGPGAEEYYRTVDLETGETGSVEREYTTMSRGGRGGAGGIGKGWFDKYMSDVYPSDQVVLRGAVMKPPRFYDGQFELVDPGAMRAVKRARLAARDPEEETWGRLEARERCTEARVARQERTVE